MEPGSSGAPLPWAAQSPDAAETAAAEARRARKEAFVTGHGGTSMWEIWCILGCLPMCSLFGEAPATACT